MLKLESPKDLNQECRTRIGLTVNKELRIPLHIRRHNPSKPAKAARVQLRSPSTGIVRLPQAMWGGVRGEENSRNTAAGREGVDRAEWTGKSERYLFKTTGRKRQYERTLYKK